MKSWLDTYAGFLSEETIREVVDNWYDTHDLHDQVDDAIFFVAEVKDEIVGFIHASEDEKAHLHRLYLLPDYQRKGIGSKLYSRMEKELKDRETSKLELEVLAGNTKGINFYREKGFYEKNSRKVKLRGEKVDEKVLVKKL